MIGPYQLLPFRARMDLGAMAMKRYSTCPESQYYWNLTIRMFSVISGHTLGRAYPYVEVQSVYSTAPTDWARYDE